MRNLASLGVLGLTIGVVMWLWQHDAGVVAIADPEDGKVTNGRYTNAYFDLTYPLPSGWAESMAGPGPSESGYYLIGTLAATNELTGTILIAAQDIFFADNALDDAATMAADFSRRISEVEGMTVDHGPTEVKLAGRLFNRVDFSGVGLYRAMFVTDLRCHHVAFYLTTPDPALLASLALSLDSLSLAASGRDGSAVPVCVKNYAVAEKVLRKVEPVRAAPRFVPIPVRIIIGADGGVKHVHVIRATAEQQRNIVDALRQWQFKPYEMDGRAVEVEVGLTMKF
jgi:hypothetical protein